MTSFVSCAMRHPGGLGDNFWGDVGVKTVPEVLGVDGEIINSVGNWS